MNRKLVAFLKQNGAYDAFVKNLEDDMCNGATAKYLLPRPMETLISRAFIWEDTKEGFDFWSRLSIRWIEEIHNKQKEE